MRLESFLKINVQKGDIFRVIKFQIFCGMPDIPDFLG